MNTTTPLSAAQIAEYYREGYLVAPGLVPASAIDRVLAAAAPRTQGLAAGGGWTPVVFDHANPDPDAVSLYHRSLRNETNEHRYAYAAQYMAEYSRLAKTGEKDPLRMQATALRQRWEQTCKL